MNKNIYKAIADFQQSVPVIHKATQGFNYSYADLPAIFETINPLLKANGLGFYQAVNGTQIKTVVFHIESGENIESNTDIPQGVVLNKMNDFQVLGSAITYLRRYALSAMLGLVTDKDTDAGGEQVKQTQSVYTTTPTIVITPESAHLQAKKAIDEADTLESLTTLNTQVVKSKNLTAEAKKELGVLINTKMGTFDALA
jgi:ERF superfamily